MLTNNLLLKITDSPRRLSDPKKYGLIPETSCVLKRIFKLSVSHYLYC